jgi:hypothetical protein
MHRSIAFTILDDEARYKKDVDTATEIDNAVDDLHRVLARINKLQYRLLSSIRRGGEGFGASMD